MRVDAFQYELPPELIAQRPADDREAARLMHLPKSGGIEHTVVAELPSLLPPGALVVLNDTRVIPARLIGTKSETGGRVEIFLVRRLGERTIELDGETRDVEVWRALGKASKPLRFGSDVHVGDGRLVVHLIGRADDDGLLEVGLSSRPGESVENAIRACGHVPLPPYIKREDDDEDVDRYQTVLSRRPRAFTSRRRSSVGSRCAAAR